jgi:flagellin
MSVINTNIKSLVSQNALVKNNRALSGAMEQLSTGKRINSAKDDAAGLAVSNRMSAQIKGLDQAVRNANDGISLIQTVEGSLNEVTSMLQRMRELSIQSANDTNTVDDRGFLDLEFQQLKEEINRIAKNTQWNGMDILSKSPNAGNGDGKFEFQVGASADQMISIQLNDFRIEPAVLGQAGGDTTIDSTGTAAISALMVGQVAASEVLVKPQISELTLAGAYAAGDTIKLEIAFGSDIKDITYTVTADNAAAADPLASIVSGIVSQAGIDSTLGVTVTTTNTGTILFTGPDGASFTPTVTSTIAAGGSATVQTETAGTGTTRESNDLVINGDFKAGDVITINNGINVVEYTVEPNDSGPANLATLASRIAAATNGYLENTTVDVNGTTITFTATEFGAGTLDLTASVANASNKFTQTQAAVPLSDAATAKTAIAQKDELTLSGSFDAGDVVKVSINGNDYEYTVTAGDAKSDDPADAVAKGIALTLLEADIAPGVTLDRNGAAIQLTGANDGTAFTSGVSVERAGTTTTTETVIAKAAGSLNMIEDTKILTRSDANTAIEKVDSAITVINRSRADMGAVMNRLTYAGDNLINVSQNTSESRSRILDADYAKASSELARTQIISQAATAMLAQANQSNQSVLQLLQG